MKNYFYKLSSAVLLIALIAVLWPNAEESKQTISYAEAAELAQGLTPKSLEQKFVNGQTGSLTVSDTATDYAIPTDVNIYTSAAKGFGNSVEYVPMPILQDINGDGLMDMLYARENYAQYTFLNNGHGFDIVYLCFSLVKDGKYNYYGHCAG